MILGIDEAGRGAWAGPLAVGGAIITDTSHPALNELRDSKKLSRKARQSIYAQLSEYCVYYVVLISSVDIDKLGLTIATKTAILQIIEHFCDYPVEQIIIDGNTAFLSGSTTSAPVQYSIKADTIYPEVMAASIAAKEQRDAYMLELSKDVEYQHYGFERHVGYGTKQHIAALELHGVSNQHRLSYAPIKRMLVS